MAGTGKAHLRSPDETLLRAEDLVVEFPVGTSGDVVHAVSGISFDLIEGETLGLVGESGSQIVVEGEMGMQGLDRHRPVEQHVDRPPDDGCGAGGQP